MTARLFVIEGTAASGKSVGAKGFDGYVACLTERQKRELETLPSLPAASAVIKKRLRRLAGRARSNRRFRQPCRVM